MCSIDSQVLSSLVCSVPCSVRVSALALLKMAMHCRSGGNIEVLHMPEILIQRVASPPLKCLCETAMLFLQWHLTLHRGCVYVHCPLCKFLLSVSISVSLMAGFFKCSVFCRSGFLHANCCHRKVTDEVIGIRSQSAALAGQGVG